MNTASSARELLGELEEVGPNVYRVAVPPAFPLATCQALSRAVPKGFWWARGGNLFHQQGSWMTYFYSPRRLGEVLAARSVYRDLTGEECPSWSLTGINKRLLRWAVEPPPWAARLEEVRSFAPPSWGFQGLLIGRHGARELVDIDAAYHQMLARLPSPRVRLREGERPRFLGLSRSERGRWQEVLAATRACKPFRLSLHGAMLGPMQPSPRYRNGVSSPAMAGPGPLFEAALLIVRSVYEVVGLQALAIGSEFTATDCLTRRAGERLELWDELGIHYSVRASGETEVQFPCVYRCGEHRSKYYDADRDWIAGRRMEFCRWSPMPERLVYREWL